MKILMIGANGTSGKKVKASLSCRHEIVAAGRNSGDFHGDISVFVVGASP
jgi:putative NADH-flavin reductase